MTVLGFSGRQITGLLLISCFVVFTVGGLLFTARNGMAGHPAPNFAYLVVERSFVIGAVILTALGLLALAEFVGQANTTALVVGRAAAVMYALAACVIIIGEVEFLRNGSFPRAMIVAYIVMALISQAVFGIILLRTGFLPSWVGWAAISWNITILAIFSILRPREVYYPALHHFVPLLIGIALLRSR